jgi:ATP-dependent RNA helicase DeaD
MTDINNAEIGFDGLGLPENLLLAVQNLGFSQPTPIQAQTIPSLLSGKHVLGEAQTGTGKTAAFGLPALASIDPTVRKPQLLVLAPTRELAIQVAEALESFAANIKGLRVATLYGGQSYGPQFQQLERGAQVVVGTPGRLMDHLRKKSLSLSNVNFCCLDEADEMLNMGFLEDIEWILEHLNDNTQMALFSATMPPAIRKVANRFLIDPVHVKIETEQKTKANIDQLFWKVSGLNKNTALERIVESYNYDALLIFVRTRSDTVMVAEQLERVGYQAAALNGDMNQAQRERTVEQLKSGKLSIVIATDVVARGLDIPRIDLVINYDLPGDTENYVHRIGRTGRAGRHGTALSFVRPREMYLLRHYERATSGRINSFELPSIQEIGKTRISRCQQSLADIVAGKDLSAMEEILANMAQESELSVSQLAAALLYEKQLKQPLQPKEDPKPRRDRERETRREGRNSRDKDVRKDGKPRGNEGRKSRSTRSDVDWQTYRLEVGREHGAKPGDIVGAIANEIALDSSYIGAISLQENHSLVQLPKGIPAATFQQLKQVRVRRRALDISVSNELVEAKAPRQGRKERSRSKYN